MRRFFFSFIAVTVLLAAVCFSPSAHAGNRRRRKYKAPPPMAQVVVTVVRAADGKPLQHAAVVFHPKQGDRNDGNMELKTNNQGVATMTIIPVGSTVLVQVIAPGYRTFGQVYEVPTDKKAITIKMRPPDQQYSIYTKFNPNTDVRTNTPHTEMGHAAPTDSPLLTAPAKKHPQWQ